MQREVTAIVLCILAQAAAAQCVAAPATPVAATIVHTVGTAPAPQNAARPGGELIKAAAAGTRDDAPPTARQTMSARSSQEQDDHPHRGGTAMLLAALALMSGIALRRYGARDA